VTTGKMKLKSQPTDLCAIVQAAIDTVRPATDAKQIIIESDGTDTAIKMVGDPDRLQQVVWNLLSNAAKFTQHGGRVAIRTESTEGLARITVVDNGPGISPKFLPHVFDRFRQADASSTRSHGGLGIGLTIVRHIVELHGGRVSAFSAGEGQGATFTVELPIIAAKIDPDQPVPAVIMQPEGAATTSKLNTDLQGARVLVVDDEIDAREVIARLLRRANAEVWVAGSAAEAIEHLMNDHPDLLISDIAMPDRDGYELIQSIRAMPGLRDTHLPAIALTAYAREEDRLRALSAGFEDHIAKPVDSDQLVSVVSGLLSRRKNRTA
jgi:CheY-like chemotaxis protein